MVENEIIDMILGGHSLIKNAEATLAAIDEREWNMVEKFSSATRKNYDIYDYCANLEINPRALTNVKNPENLTDELNMTYNEYVDHLIIKYGYANCDFFYGPHCETENRNIHRLSTDGLFLHHIAEECMVTFEELTSKEYAKGKPFVLMQQNNFIYCDYLEHLLLHMKIAKEDWEADPQHTRGVDVNGARLIWRELNWFFSLGKSYLPKRKAIERIKDRRADYITIMQYFRRVLVETGMNQYCPEDDIAEDVNGLFSQNLFSEIRR